MKKLTP